MTLRGPPTGDVEDKLRERQTEGSARPPRHIEHTRCQAGLTLGHRAHDGGVVRQKNIPNPISTAARRRNTGVDGRSAPSTASQPAAVAVPPTLSERAPSRCARHPASGAMIPRARGMAIRSRPPDRYRTADCVPDRRAPHAGRPASQSSPGTACRPCRPRGDARALRTHRDRDLRARAH
jgi:hypothetical protein